MISALADAGAALARPDYRDAAVACAEFVWRDMRDPDGRLLRSFDRGQARLAPTWRTTHSCWRRS